MCLFGDTLSERAHSGSRNDHDAVMVGNEDRRYFKSICDNQMRPEVICDFHHDKITGGKVAKL